MISLFTSVLDWLRTVTPVQVKAYYWAAQQVYLSPWFWGFTLSIFLLEWVRPGVRTQRVFSWGLAQDFVWLNADIAFKVAALPAFVGLLQLLYDSTTGGYTVAALVPLPLPVKIIAAVVIFDFLQWGNHWIRHKVRPFWHFHSIHHSQRELNVFTDVRIHSVEYFIAETLAFLPMLFLGVPALAVMGVGGFRMWYARFVHANIGTNLGPLKHILVTPQYHRVHHSIEPAHQDKNFGVLFTLWDRIFGTMNRNYDEYPATGVIGLDFPPPGRFAPSEWMHNFLRMLVYPFQALRKPDTRKVDLAGPRSPSRGSVMALLLVAAPGSPPADTYPRQPLDVEHYRFALTVNDSTDRIEGQATLRMRLLQANQSRVELDLAEAGPGRNGRGMVVSSVTRNGLPLAFAHAADRLAITLDRPSASGEVVELVVRYAGIPADGLQIKPTKYGDRSFFSDDWPDKARHWLPTVDHIADKATMEMAVVAPAHYQVISNGLQVEETDLPGGLRRTVWRESVPIAPWLYVLGVARFAVQHLGEYRGIPLETWVFAQDRDAGFYDFAVPVREVMAFYSESVGPFSYEKLANVQSNSVSGGMEAASAILYSAGSVSGTRPLRWRNVIIHEIAHQWFGDAVTESDWNDVWLSEGFATYFTLLFIEHAYGRDEFVAGLRDSRKTVLDFYQKTPDYRVVHQNLSDMKQVTSAMTYQKGSWVLHMLRQAMGDDRFWAGIREYYARFRDSNASTTDFQMAMERASGLDLAGFFQQWLYQGGVPRVEGTWQWDAATRQVIVDFRQTQPGEPFRLSLEIGIAEPGARARVEVALLSGREGHFTFAAAREPTALELDPNTRLLFDGHLLRRGPASP